MAGANKSFVGNVAVDDDFSFMLRAEFDLNLIRCFFPVLVFRPANLHFVKNYNVHS